jgi:hypothetical protein
MPQVIRGGPFQVINSVATSRGLNQRYLSICSVASHDQVGYKGAPVSRDAVDRAEQLSHAGNDLDLRSLARSQEAIVMRAQPGVFPDGD